MKKPDENNFIISADIGGSHITVAIIDTDNKVVLNETRISASVYCHGTADEILQTWARVIKEVRNKTSEPVNRLALAMPGPFDYQSGISLITGLQKYESLYGINVKQYLSKTLGIDEENIRFRNDAEAFLHGEVNAGAGQGFRKVLGFTLGTGMGSAISSNGITTDANWGSVPYEANVADDYFSTRWFLKCYRQLSGLQCLNVKELAELAATNVTASDVFHSFAKNFAGFISRYILEEKPDLIVIGGNIAKGQRLFLPQLKEHLSACIDPARCVIGQLDEDAALIGAAFTFEMNELKTGANG